MKYLLFIIIVLFSNISYSATNNITPLPSEKLSNPIVLSCGLTITESQVKNIDVNYLNDLCLISKKAFEKMLKTHLSKKFKWNMSLLYDGTCNRCLNDFSRFNRTYEVYGYTDKNSQYIFITDDVYSKEFVVTFFHEMYHAFSMYYGFYDMHPGPWQEKSRQDDMLAEQFTISLGLGK